MTMIERVAKAICNAGRKDDMWDILTHNNTNVRTSYFEEAKAAIEAMREITDEMYDAGDDASLSHGPDWVWAKMIDAALKE